VRRFGRINAAAQEDQSSEIVARAESSEQRIYKERHMATFNPATDRCLTAFIHVKTSPEWLSFTIPERVEKINGSLRRILKDFSDSIIFRWYDTEFYTAKVTDIMVMDCKDPFVYQHFLDKLRETEFWDKWFIVEEIIIGELNAASKTYGFKNIE
jgi:hypothetical protein